MPKSKVRIELTVNTELTGKALAKSIAEEFSIVHAVNSEIMRGHEFIPCKWSKGKVTVEVAEEVDA